MSNLEKQRFHFRLNHLPFSHSVSLHFFCKLDDGRVVTLSEPPKMAALPPEASMMEQKPIPLLEMNHSDCQALVEELWNAGFRPRESHGSAGEIGAVKNHLEHVSGLLAQLLQPVINQANASTLALAAPHTTAKP